METEGKSCPVSGNKVNENVVRFIAAFVAALTTLAVSNHAIWLSGFLALDFALRGFISPQLSPLRFIACQFNSLVQLPPKLVDEAPKRFAAKIGFFVVGIIVSLQVFDFQVAAFILGSVLVLLASLEAILAFCVGCILYQQLQQLKWGKKTFVVGK
jgi:Domain of unknown function (DUF4395)